MLRSFYSALFTLVMPDFERLRRPGTRADARRSTALLVAAAHETVHRLVSREDSGYGDRSFLLHTPEQVCEGRGGSRGVAWRAEGELGGRGCGSGVALWWWWWTWCITSSIVLQASVSRELERWGRGREWGCL